MSQSADAELELWRWCQEHGASALSITAGFVAEGWRGIVASADIKQNSCILEVPEAILMSEKSALADAHLLRSLPGSPATGQTLLALHLLNEMAKGAASFWAPYLSTLPRSYTTAMCLSSAAVEALQVAYAQQAAAAAGERALQQWQQALPLLDALELPPKWRSKAAWLWASSTLSSRTMFLPNIVAGALTPFGDLHNYGAPPPPVTPQLGRAAPGNAALDTQLDEGLWGDGNLDEAAHTYRIFARRE